MRFFNAENLNFLWLLVGVAFFLYWSLKRRKRALKQIADAPLLKGLLQDVLPNAQKWKGLFILLGLFCSILALARPQWDFHWEEIKQKGNDIFIGIDTSKSMLAEDVKPNRLTRAKREVKDLLQLLKGDRVGLIAFAGTSFVLSPLTLDTAALRLFLDDVSPDIIPQGGTALSEAIRKALKSFPGKDKGHKILILLTDGEDLEGGVLETARQAKAEGVQIYTVGIGTPEGAPIPILDEAGNRVFVKDKQGQTVLSKLNLSQLSQLSDKGVQTSIAEVYQKYILPMEKKELETTRQKKYEEKFQWFLLLAILFFILEFLVREKRKKKVFVSLLFLSVLLNSSSVEAATASSHVKKGNSFYADEKWDEALNRYIQAQAKKPDSALIQHNLGDALYKQGKYQEARDVYEKGLTLEPQEELKPELLYNLGNAQFRLGKYQEALDNYEKALNLTPEDEDVQFNYELVKKLLEQLEKQQEQKQDPSDSKEGEQKEQQDQQSSQEQSGDREQEELEQNPSEEGEEEDQEKEAQDQSSQEEEKEEEQKQGSSEQDQKEKDPSEEQQQSASAQEEGQEQKQFTEQEAEALLKALKEEELNTRELRMDQRKRGKVVQPEKDW